MSTSGRNAPGELKLFLRQVPLFAGLDEAALDDLARVSYIRRVPKGCVVFNLGDEGNAAYIVRSGSIAIVVDTRDGRELALSDMRPGDCFGEMALLTGAPRSATAIAREPAELVLIARREFLEGLAAQPVVMQRVIQTLCDRLRLSTERESALAFMDAPARLARVLLELERKASARGFLTISQEELSRHAGITRQTTVKILAGWRRKHWVITGRGKIMILDRAALGRAAARA